MDEQKNSSTIWSAAFVCVTNATRRCIENALIKTRFASSSQRTNMFPYHQWHDALTRACVSKMPAHTISIIAHDQLRLYRFVDALCFPLWPYMMVAKKVSQIRETLNNKKINVVISRGRGAHRCHHARTKSMCCFLSEGPIMRFAKFSGRNQLRELVFLKVF